MNSDWDDDSAGVCVYAEYQRWVKCEGDVTYGPDPFDAEINDDFTEVWMCKNHRYERAMDI